MKHGFNSTILKSKQWLPRSGSVLVKAKTDKSRAKVSLFTFGRAKNANIYISGECT